MDSSAGGDSGGDSSAIASSQAMLLSREV